MLVIGYLASRVVASHRRLQERNEELAAANKEVLAGTERKSAFLASMSHELRTPMNAIVGFTGLVIRRSGDALPKLQRENLEKVTESAHYLLSLINDILDLSKVEAGRMDVDAELFKVKGLIAMCCSTISPLLKPGVELKYEVPDDIGEANTDRSRVQQILINLLSNAAKFTREGEVGVRVERDNADHLVISVWDTGTGIPEADRERIFEEFRQVEGSDKEKNGKGLGLANTRKLSVLLGGTISVESKMGEGSTFTLRIPATYRPPESEAE